jgi:hypothetical protein
MSAEADIEARSKLVAALSAGATIAAAAKASGYSYRQAHRLAHSPEVVAEVEKNKAGLPAEHPDVQAAKAFLRGVVDGKEEDDPPALSVRVQAAKALIAAHQTQAPRSAKPKEAPAPAVPTGPDPTPDELQRGLRVLA